MGIHSRCGSWDSSVLGAWTPPSSRRKLTGPRSESQNHGAKRRPIRDRAVQAQACEWMRPEIKADKESIMSQPNKPSIVFAHRSEEHTSELQSLRHIVCRL